MFSRLFAWPWVLVLNVRETMAPHLNETAIVNIVVLL